MPGETEPPGGREQPPLIKWDTLHEIGLLTLPYEEPVAGKVLEVELAGGTTIRVWRASDGRQYFCHGLTFGGKDAPGGPISPFGQTVPTILREHFQAVPEGAAGSGDILVWQGLDANEVIHSAILTAPLMAPGRNYLDYSARLRSKNGIEPEADWSLGQLIDLYGESYNTFRRT
jgi:hypothetical protein